MNSPLSRPLLVTFSVLTGADVLVAGAALGDLVDKKWIGLAGLIQGAVTAGLAFYVAGHVTPAEHVAARRTAAGDIVAGPAAAVANGKPVDVVASEPTKWA